MKKGLKRTIIYSAIVGAFMVGAFVCYGISRNYRAQYSNLAVEIVGEKDEGKKAELVAKQQSVDDQHKVVGTAAYVLTIGALASFGVCLAVSDKIKAKEEAIAEGRAK